MVEIPPTLTHNPDRPSWLCTVDGKPWPCEPAKKELEDKFQGNDPGLSIYLAEQLYTAARDLVDTITPAQLNARFLLWSAAVRGHVTRPPDPPTGDHKHRLRGDGRQVPP